MHFEADRRLSDDELARLRDDVARVLGDVRLSVRDFHAMEDGWPDEATSPRPRPPATRARKWPRPSPSWTGCRRTTSSSWATASTSFEGSGEDARVRVVQARASASCPTHTDSAYAEPACGWPISRPACASGCWGPADRDLEDQPRGHRPPPREDGLPGREAGRRGRLDRRRAADGGPVHQQGVHGAGPAHPAGAPQARAHHGRGGPVPGLARLQGRRHDLRELPQGRAVRRLRRGPASAR